MRKGALITGRNICNSSPVVILGRQFVLDSTCRSFEGTGFNRLPPVHLKPASNAGQPNAVLMTESYCWVAIWSCEGRIMGSMPVSRNGAIATGPKIGMRDSRLVITLTPPPGEGV